MLLLTSGKKKGKGTILISVPALIKGTASATPGDTIVTLSATEPSGGSGGVTYQWYWSAVSGSLGSALTGATLRSHSDTSLTNGVTRYYTLIATDSAGSTATYDQVSVTPVVGTMWINHNFESNIVGDNSVSSLSPLENPYNGAVTGSGQPKVTIDNDPTGSGRGKVCRINWSGGGGTHAFMWDTLDCSGLAGIGLGQTVYFEGEYYLDLIDDTYFTTGPEYQRKLAYPRAATTCPDFYYVIACFNNGMNLDIGAPVWGSAITTHKLKDFTHTRNEWHKFKQRITMDSAINARDGIAEFWYDGACVFKTTTARFTGDPAVHTTNDGASGNSWATVAPSAVNLRYYAVGDQVNVAADVPVSESRYWDNVTFSDYDPSSPSTLNNITNFVLSSTTIDRTIPKGAVTFTVRPRNINNWYIYGKTISAVSSNTGVCTVTASADTEPYNAGSLQYVSQATFTITPVAVGTATITVSCDGHSEDIIVNISDPTDYAISINTGQSGTIATSSAALAAASTVGVVMKIRGDAIIGGITSGTRDLAEISDGTTYKARLGVDVSGTNMALSYQAASGRNGTFFAQSLITQDANNWYWLIWAPSNTAGNVGYVGIFTEAGAAISETSNITSSSMDTAGSRGKFCINSRITAPGATRTLVCDTVQVWTKKPTIAEALAAANGDSGLVHLIKFTEGSGTTAANSVTGSGDMVMTGTEVTNFDWLADS